MGKIKIVQTRSIIGSTKRQKRTIAALGLGKPRKCREVEATPQIMGMVNKVKHLIKVEENK